MVTHICVIFIIFELQSQNLMSKPLKPKHENQGDFRVLTNFVLIYKHFLCIYTKAESKDERFL